MQKLVTENLLFCISRFVVEGKLRTNSLKETLDKTKTEGRIMVMDVVHAFPMRNVQDADIYTRIANTDCI